VTIDLAEDFATRQQELEEDTLSPLAARSYPARRRQEEPDSEMRTPLQRDVGRVVHCKAFRRLKHKTQVFVAPEGDHYRTRLTHTLEVTQISRAVARALRLNEDLVEAIGVAHDLGHPPFGHVGEDALDHCLQEKFGRNFRHYEHSLRIVDELERDGRGLNLTEDVRDGIVCHSGRSNAPKTLEGRIVRIVDRVAYINHDIDDSIRAGALNEKDLPASAIKVLGKTGSSRIDMLVRDIVEQSRAAGDIAQGDEAGQAMDELRTHMFENVYFSDVAKQDHKRIENVIGVLFEHFVQHPELTPAAVAGADDAQRVTDYIAGMTDRYCLRVFEDLTLPHSFAL
jgi:dGTPase